MEIIFCDFRVSQKVHSGISSNQWRNQGGGKWAIAHFIWRFAHRTFYQEVFAH